jgi:abortive infection bacteriophage resistance protein
MMEGIAEEEARSTENFVRHYRATYTAERFLPIWMVTELISLGALSKMYGGLNRRTQRQISNVYGIPEGSMQAWMHTLNYVRNACAHHNRLWNRKIAIAPTFPPGWQHAVPENDKLYAVLLLIQHLLGIIAPKSRWKERLIFLLLREPRLYLKWMGFPENWLELEPWSFSNL